MCVNFEHYCRAGLEEDLRGDKDDKDEEKSDSSDKNSEEEVEKFDENLQPIETPYGESAPEELGQVGRREGEGEGRGGEGRGGEGTFSPLRLPTERVPQRNWDR